MKKIVTILPLISGFTVVKAQQRPETGLWFTVMTPVNFSKHWQWHNDAGYRTLGASAEALQYLYRTGIRYNFNQQWNTAGGVAFFFTRTSFSKSNDEFGHEFRFWEEVNRQKQVSKKLNWQLRLRTEQRFFAATSVKAKYTAWRFRFRTGLTQKINDKWSLQLADEYMQQQTNQKLSFDQNRVMLSGIYYVNKTTQLQGGYMWLRWPNDNQHILTVRFIKNISLHGD
jgi:long-subunit fatty acid transport protein